MPDSLARVFAVGWDGSRVQVYPEDVPLALNNITLQARSKGSAAQLSWHIMNEGSTLQYEVQHSADAMSFTTVGRLDDAGRQDYSYFDPNALTDGRPNYYRIAAVDRDSSLRYSNIAEVTIDNYILSTYPVPFDANLTIQLATSGAVKQVKMFGASGLVIEPAWVQQGRTVSLTAASVAAGVYIVALTDAHGQSMSIKVIKK